LGVLSESVAVCAEVTKVVDWMAQVVDKVEDVQAGRDPFDAQV
jgi:hypothetical protein